MKALSGACWFFLVFNAVNPNRIGLSSCSSGSSPGRIWTPVRPSLSWPRAKRRRWPRKGTPDNQGYGGSWIQPEPCLLISFTYLLSFLNATQSWSIKGLCDEKYLHRKCIFPLISEGRRSTAPSRRTSRSTTKTVLTAQSLCLFGALRPVSALTGNEWRWLARHPSMWGPMPRQLDHWWMYPLCHQVLRV